VAGKQHIDTDVPYKTERCKGADNSNI